MISVLCVTNRVGGLDLLADSLRRQTYRDFELVLVDSIRPYRAAYSFPTDMRVQWLDDWRDDNFTSRYMAAQNKGIEHARGDTILFACDYSYFAPDCLEKHAEAQKRAPGPVCFDYEYRTMPAPKPGLPNYRETISGTKENAAEYGRQCHDNATRYAADLKSGKLSEFMWSIFAEPLTPEAIAALPLELEQKPSTADLANDWNWCSLKNESIPTELLLDMNGFEEDYDGSHGWQDSSFSYRLRARGIRWHHGGPGCTLTVVNPRHWSNIKTLTRPLFSNQELCFNSRRAELGLPVNPGFSLRERRKARLGL